MKLILMKYLLKALQPLKLERDANGRTLTNFNKESWPGF